jgi:hypothetical protein
MKFGFLLFCSAFIILAIGSCSKYEGNFCNVGLEGDSCKTLSRDKYIGNWDVDAKTVQGGTQYFIIQMTTAASDSAHFLISNMNNKGYTIECNILSSNAFEIVKQTSTGRIKVLVTGTGKLDNGKLKIDYEEAGVPFTVFATKK